MPPSKKKKTGPAARSASAGSGGKVSASAKKSSSPKQPNAANVKKNSVKSEKKPAGKKGVSGAKLPPAKKSLSKAKTKSAPPSKPQPKVAKVPATKPSVAKIAPPAKPKSKSEKGKAPLAKKGHAASADPKAVASKHSIKAASPAPIKPATPAMTRPMAARKAAPTPPPKKTGTSPEIVAKIRSVQAEKEQRKDLAQTPPKKTLTPITSVPPVIKGQDRIVLMVRDPYWLHAHWDVTRQTVDRAKAALVEQWHSVKPILRLLKLDDSGTTESAENIYRDIEIHGGVRNWYIDVDQPPSRFQIVMGYMTGNGRFYELVRSNTVTTPVPGGKEASDDHWADIAKDAERIYAMSGGYGDETQRGELSEVFEERLNRTMDLDVLSQFGSGAEGGLKRSRQFHFDVDAELIVFGSTHPDAHVSVGTEPVKVRSDGTFSIRLPFPDRRQVLPATARSRDGVDEQTVVIAVERNTKVMEPLSLEGDEQ